MIFRTNLDEEFPTPERCFITEILNTEGIGQLSISRARVQTGVTTQLHSLDVDECYYILEGKGVMEIGGEIKEEIRPGDIAFIKSGSSQRVTNTTDQDLIFLCICTPKFFVKGYTSLE